ncbi:MAG: indole-3-glycerol phosphate synthase TrpC [Coriobacteriales bacterium]|jgi:indole-3-glycerol phosphate synthase|nr:indole-3-glycerol phosphate synthase TrpC [Coriobacteriales bacterium]
MNEHESFLERIVASTQMRVEDLKQINATEAKVSAAQSKGRFAASLSVPGLSFICEIKKASPSKGEIVQSFPYLQIAHEYELAGAAAISVLTEPVYFKGDFSYLKEVSASVGIPTLCKDFIIDAIQVHQAKANGAAAILLIVAILNDEQLLSLRLLAESLGMDVLVETHDASEIKRALKSGARIVGVNNRNLKTFQVDLGIAENLRASVPDDIIFVAESGITSAADVSRMVACKADAILVGESLMRSTDRALALNSLRKAANDAHKRSTHGKS